MLGAYVLGVHGASLTKWLPLGYCCPRCALNVSLTISALVVSFQVTYKDAKILSTKLWFTKPYLGKYMSYRVNHFSYLILEYIMLDTY